VFALLARLWALALTGARRAAARVLPEPGPQTSDDELIEAALGGEGEAFEELLQRHLDAMYSVAVRITLRPSDADDVVQEASVRIWRALDQFERRSKFSTWVFRITTNVALNLVSREREPTVELDADLPAPSDNDPERRAEAGAKLEAAVAAFESLPPDQRSCLTLREAHGLAYEEIAEVLDLTIPAVKGQLFRARQHLAATLSRFDAGGVVEGGVT
jgi:RNA polymerase sigma-70 factor, ECF subfamily